MENPGGGRRGLWEGRRHRPAPCYPGRPRKRAGLAPRLRKRPPPIPERPGPVRGARLGSGRPASSRGAMGSVDHTHASTARTADPRVSTRLLRDPGEGFAPPSRPARRNFPGCVLKTLAECGAKDPRNRGGPAALMPSRAVSKSSTLSGLPSPSGGAPCSRISGSGWRASRSERSTACKSSCAACGVRPRGNGPSGGRGLAGLRKLRARPPYPEQTITSEGFFKTPPEIDYVYAYIPVHGGDAHAKKTMRDFLECMQRLGAELAEFKLDPGR